MNELAVIHLARGSNGPTPLHRFLESYQAHQAGIDHAIYVAFKGYAKGPLEHDRAVAVGAGASTIVLSRDDLMDIGAYREAAEHMNATWLVFINSFSVILVDGWLGRLQQAICEPGVGIAGATGSWESQTTNAFNLIRQYKGARDVLRWLYKLRYSPPFPNAHLRTNAFIVRRDLFCKLSIPLTSRKQAAYAFESGRMSMTRQIQQRSLKPVVVGRQGIFGISDWPFSRTYCAGTQENLLIADNRTREYAESDPEGRIELAGRVWGRNVCLHI